MSSAARTTNGARLLDPLPGRRRLPLSAMRATTDHSPPHAAVGYDIATAIFPTADDGGYWIATAAGAVYHFGDATNRGSMAGHHLNGSIIAGVGW